MDSVLSTEQRRMLVVSLKEAGAPPDQANIVADLAAQACDRAIDAFLNVMNLAPTVGDKLTVISVGAQLLTHQLKRLEAANERIGSMMAGKPTTVKVSL